MYHIIVGWFCHFWGLILLKFNIHSTRMALILNMTHIGFSGDGYTFVHLTCSMFSSGEMNPSLQPSNMIENKKIIESRAAKFSPTKAARLCQSNCSLSHNNAVHAVFLKGPTTLKCSSGRWEVRQIGSVFPHPPCLTSAPLATSQPRPQQQKILTTEGFLSVDVKFSRSLSEITLRQVRSCQRVKHYCWQCYTLRF